MPSLFTRPAGRTSPNWLILTIACVAQFMVVLDVSIVNVALPSIGRDLHYSPTGLQWVVNAYVLTFAGFLLLGGRAADLYGRRRVYIFGLVLFSLASLVGGLAENAGWLTAARAVQGIGGAVLSPATLTIIVTTFSGAQLAKSIGIWSAASGAGGAVGSILGGVLTAELSWRWVLFVNVPIGAAVLLGALFYLTEAKREDVQHKLDVAGAITVTAGLGAVIYAIVGTNTNSWGSSRTLSFLGAGAVLLAIFLFIERRIAHTPLVPFNLFRSRSVTGSNLVMILVGSAFFSMWYFLTLYLQNVLHYSALRAGTAFVPMAIMIIVGAQISSRLVPRIGIRPLLLVGTLVAMSGFIWLTQIHDNSTYWADIFGAGCMTSLALGLLFTPLATAATSGVRPDEAGLASGVLNTSRQVGGSLGLAILATIAIDRTNSAISGQHASVDSALASGYSRAFTIAAGIALCAFAASFIVPSLGHKTGRDEAVAPGPPGVEGNAVSASGLGDKGPTAGVGSLLDPEPA
jgi:EmrB/QacA subfamily drug resistance transporter